MIPPVLDEASVISIPATSICFWVFMFFSISFKFLFCLIDLSLLITPRPEHGASTSTRSNISTYLGRILPSMLTITWFLTPMRDRLYLIALHRSGSGSLIQSSPRFFICIAMWVDLPPGAAHRSKIRSPGKQSIA